MRVEHKETAKNDANCEIRLGVASWDDGSCADRSVKYTWFTKNGKAARGGEFPVEALPQALDFAIRKGYLEMQSIDEVLHTLEAFCAREETREERIKQAQSAAARIRELRRGLSLGGLRMKDLIEEGRM